jgi:hypothetical protein
MFNLRLKRKFFMFNLIILLILLSLQTVAGANDYIRHPDNIPQFALGQKEELKQSKSTEFTLSIVNRYENKITNVYLIINFYKMVTSSGPTPFEQVNYIPIFKESNGPDISFDWNEQAPGSTHIVSFNVNAYELTPAGTYYLRMAMVFDYNGTTYTLKSQGFFTSEQWTYAEQTGTTEDPDGINIDSLGVDGIIPDIAFDIVAYEVKEDENYDWIIWPAVIILIVVVVIGILYYQKRSKKEENDE